MFNVIKQIQVVLIINDYINHLSYVINYYYKYIINIVIINT